MYSVNNDEDVEFDNEFYAEAERIVLERENEMSSDVYEENEAINGAITYEEVHRIVTKLKNKKACGIDEVPNEVLKNNDVIYIY